MNTCVVAQKSIKKMTNADIIHSIHKEKLCCWCAEKSKSIITCEKCGLTFCCKSCKQNSDNSPFSIHNLHCITINTTIGN